MDDLIHTADEDGVELSTIILEFLAFVMLVSMFFALLLFV